MNTTVGRHRVLIVDDNPSNVAILTEIFEEDHEVEAAGSGEEALKIASRFRPDVVLLDIMMPGIDGYEVCRRMRADKELWSVKIVFLSAKASTEERLEGYAAGADDYLVKPFDVDEVRAKAAVFVRLKRAEELLELKRELLDLLSCDTTSPLRGVLVPAATVHDKAEMSEDELRRYARVIGQNVDRLQRFFDDVIKLCALRGRNWRLEPRPIGVGDLVACAMTKAANTDRTRHVSIRSGGSPEAIVIVDAEQTTSAVRVLLDLLAVSSAPDSEVVVAAIRVGPWVELEITGTAPSIRDLELGDIFHPLVDLDDLASISESGERLGLEVSIAKEVFEAHGGSLGLECGPNDSVTLRARIGRHADAEGEYSGGFRAELSEASCAAGPGRSSSRG
jgi:two-component system sensor histidine kinase/response regulator